MKSLIRTLHLPSGLTVSFYNLTRQYFGDYYLVKMEIQCKVPVLPKYFDDLRSFDEASLLLGHEVVYKRVEQQMGVPSTDVERSLARLMTNFMEHSHSYFASTLFPGKLILAELNKIRRKRTKALYP